MSSSKLMNGVGDGQIKLTCLLTTAYAISECFGVLNVVLKYLTKYLSLFRNRIRTKMHMYDT